MLKLNCVMLSSSQPKVLAAFYGEVLQAEPTMVDDKNGIIGYVAGDCFFGIGPHDEVKGANDCPGRIIYFFESQDVKADFERIKAIEGATVVQEPYDPTGGDKAGLATIADPDGNYFQLASPWNEGA